MPWSSAGTISLLTTNWQYTDPIEGEHFRFKHFEAPNGAGYAIAQAVFLEDGTVQFIDSQVLFYENGVIDALRLKKPEWATERRLGFKKFPRQSTFEEDLRRLLLPGFMQAPTQDIFNFVRKSEWRVDIEVSDYVEVKKDYTAQFADVSLVLTTIERKIDNINTSSSSGSTSAQKNLSYVSNGDTNGVFYYFGTAKGTRQWMNPSDKINFSASSVLSGRGADKLADRSISEITNDAHTNEEVNAWFKVDLGANNNLVITHYTLQARNTMDQQPRNWKLQASNDDATYVDIDLQTNNSVLTNGSFYSKAISGQTQSYRYFKLLQTGLNSSNANYFVLGEWEIYGVLYST